MRSQLERAINLASNTGDKIIVVDELNDRSSVVMNLDEYEKLLNGESKGNKKIKNLTEEELLDKINHDITTWKDAKDERDFFADLDDDEDDLDFDDEMPAFAKATADEDDDFEDEPSFAKATEDEEDDAIFPDFTPPSFDSEGNLITEPESAFAEATADKSDFAEATADKVEKKEEPEENLYYYNEPESAFAKATADKEEESGFTSIKDELKRSKKAWEIPEEVKKSAEDIKI